MYVSYYLGSLVITTRSSSSISSSNSRGEGRWGVIAVAGAKTSWLFQDSVSLCIFLIRFDLQQKWGFFFLALIVILLPRMFLLGKIKTEERTNFLQPPEWKRHAWLRSIYNHDSDYSKTESRIFPNYPNPWFQIHPSNDFQVYQGMSVWLRWVLLYLAQCGKGHQDS